MFEGSERLSVTTDVDGTLLLDGELDAHSAPELGAAFDARSDGEQVVADLSELTFMDSSGLRIIISTHKRLGDGGGSLTLRNPTRSVQRLLSVSGLDGHFTIATD